MKYSIYMPRFGSIQGSTINHNKIYGFLDLFRYHTDSEEIMLDDALHMDTIRRSDMYDTGLPFGTHSSVFEYPEHSIYASIRQSRVKNEDKMMGLAEAIVKSILSSGMS